jgi:thioredoxin 1
MEVGVLRKIFMVLACAAAVGCSDGTGGPASAPSATGKESAAVSAGRFNMLEASHHLVFFLDPQGGPCIMQAQILSGMGDELRGRAEIRYVQTTVPEDRRLFAQYGIRALPTLLLADAAGNEIQRLAPGVKNQEEIRLLLQAIH